MNSRDIIMQRILAERDRQFNLPGREFDGHNSVNDWVALILSYVSEAASRNHLKPEAFEFEDALIKGAAILIAALEHVEMMKHKAHFRGLLANLPELR